MMILGDRHFTGQRIDFSFAWYDYIGANGHSRTKMIGDLRLVETYANAYNII